MHLLPHSRLMNIQRSQGDKFSVTVIDQLTNGTMLKSTSMVYSNVMFCMSQLKCTPV